MAYRSGTVVRNRVQKRGLLIAALAWCFGVHPANPSYAQMVNTTIADQEIRGLVRSSGRIEVRTDLVAAVKSAPFIDGMPFQKGDVLLSFDCGRYQAELNSARAAANAAAIELRNKRRLLKHGAAGRSEVQLARAEAARTNADVSARLARMAQCSIKAPFAGRVVQLNTRPHEMPKANEPVIVVINDSELELELVVPSRWLTWLSAGQSFSFKVDETGKTHQASVVRLGAEVDPVSQTIKAYGRFSNQARGVLAGMSGAARFKGQGS